MKVLNNTLSRILFYLLLKIFMKEAIFVIAKETEKRFEVMNFINLMSSVSGKLDLNEVF